MIRIAVDPQHPDPALVEEAARWLREGGVAAIPTDTLYGLAADPFNRAAVARVFSIKGRPSASALPLVAADSPQVRAWIGALSELGDRLANRFWPGPLTLVVAAPASIAPEVTAGERTVGVRVPAHAVTRALCAAAGRPLTATSANLSGQPATADPREVAEGLGDAIDILLDAGMAPGGPPSTIVDVTAAEPRMIRAGAIDWKDILACSRPE